MRLRSSGIIVLCSAAAIAGLVAAGPAQASGGGDSAGRSGPVPVIGGGGTPHAGALPRATRGRNASPRTKAAPFAKPELIPSNYSVRGIDVSSHQGNVNWAKARAAGARFTYAKATEGTTYYNPYFEQQYGGAKDAGLYVGAYVFARPDGSAVAQARYFYDNADYVRDGRTMPLMLDLEGPYNGLRGTYNRCWNRGTSSMVGWIRSFVTEIGHLSGSPMLIYTNNGWWAQCTGNSAAFGGEYLNTAYWSTTAPAVLPPSWTQWTVWQNSDRARAGLPGDQDVFNGSMKQLRRYADRPIRGKQRMIPNDFNLDQHTDLAVFDPETGQWQIQRDTGTTTTHFGTSGDVPLTWDSGNGWAKMAVFRPSTGHWYLANHLGHVKYAVTYGGQEDIPVPAHYRGDHKTTVLAVYRPSNGDWYVRDVGKIHYGTSSDIPVPGHYRTDPTHTDTIAVFRPRNGTWHLHGIGKVHWGERGDIPAPADYDGDGVTDIAVFRPSSGTWYVRGVGKFHYGQQGDIPVTVDRNGDGKAEPAVFRPSTGRFFIQRHQPVSLGTDGDIPVGRAPQHR